MQVYRCRSDTDACQTLIRREDCVQSNVSGRSYLEPNDDGSVEMTVGMIGVVEPPEHVRARPHLDVRPDLRVLLLAVAVRHVTFAHVLDVRPKLC